MNRIKLKQYLKLNNKSGFKTHEKHIENKFPNIYKIIITLNPNNNWFTNLYNYLYNINENKLCSQCGKTLYVKIFSLGYPKYCSTFCKNTNDDFKKKVKKSCLLKYGVDNPSKSNVIKKKIKDKLCRNGKWYVETDEYKKKSKETCIRKYGVDSYSKLDEYHEKVKKTSIKKYGVNSYNKTKESKENVKEKNIKKYGVEYYTQTKEYKIKTKKTNIRKYGVEYYSQTDECKRKVINTNLKKYGTKYYTQTDEFKKRMINTMIEKYGELWLKHIPKYNPNSIIYLDLLSEKSGLQIQHALNGGEKKFIRYWVDGYVEKYNICIEWNEKHHNSKRQKERDKIKEIFIIENFNCNIIHINEQNFLKNIETSINDICCLFRKYSL